MMIQGTHNLAEIYNQRPTKVIVVEKAVVERDRNYINEAMEYLKGELDNAMKTKGLKSYESYYDIAERAIVIDLNWG